MTHLTWSSVARVTIAWLLFLAPAVARAGGPSWRVTWDGANRRYAIRVSAAALAKNEYVESAKCTVVLLDSERRELATETHEMAPIASGDSRTTEFTFEHPRAASVRGKIMDWEVVAKGSIVAEGSKGTSHQGSKGTSHRGSSPPE
jgi:hypothetical protein